MVHMYLQYTLKELMRFMDLSDVNESGYAILYCPHCFWRSPGKREAQTDKCGNCNRRPLHWLRFNEADVKQIQRNKE